MDSAPINQNKLMTKDNATPKTAKAATPAPTEGPEPKSGSYIRIPKKLAIGVGVGAAALGLIAGTSVISFAIADQFDNDDRYFVAPTTTQDSGGGQQAPSDAFETGGSAAGGPAAAPVAPSSGSNQGSRSADITATIAQFTAARDAAVVAAGGGSAIAIDRDPRGWEVYVYTNRGEVEVRLDETLAVIALDEPDADDRNDPAPQTVLNGNVLNNAIAAAIAAAGSGAATDVEAAEWDDRPGYTVTLVLANGVELDVYLDPNLNVTSTEIDD